MNPGLSLSIKKFCFENQLAVFKNFYMLWGAYVVGCTNTLNIYRNVVIVGVYP